MAWAYALKDVASRLPLSCEVAVFTAVYYDRPMRLAKAPNAGCSVAFVNEVGKHRLPGWMQVAYLDAPGDLPRSAHVVKIPVWMDRPVVYLDLKLTVSPLPRQMMPPGCYDVAVTMHPSFASRSVNEELKRTSSHMQSRKMGAGVHLDLKVQAERMRRTDFDMDATRVMPDTYYVAWNHTERAMRFAALWYDEVSRFSMREQTNFNFVANVTQARVRYLPHRHPFGAVPPRARARVTGPASGPRQSRTCP